MSVLIARENRNSSKAKDSNLSKKIDKKLDFVAESIAHVAGDKFDRTESGLFWKRVFFKGLKFMNCLDLRYNYENRLVSISYNLELGSEIPTDERFHEVGTCSFEVIAKGHVRFSEPEWTCTIWNGEEEERQAYLNRLNHHLVMDRIKNLDLQKIKVTHREGSGTWEILCESLIGSSTWVLIPPVVNLIKPTDRDCIQFVEFFELVSDAVADNR